MNIQNYILPEWKKKIADEGLPGNIEEKFVIYGESMAEYLDRFMMRSLPKNWYRGWTRYKFPLSTDSLVIDMHEVIAKNFGVYVSKYRSGEKDAFNLDSDEIDKIKQLEQEYQAKLTTEGKEFNDIKTEISEIRKVREERPKKEKKKSRARRKKSVKSGSEASQELKEGEADSKSPEKVPDHDFVYKKWMEMVESKPISKSYWHIHEYMSRYILDFAKKHTANGEITKELIEDFLADYGKGKRPKTMNHYNRVVYRFWEFYENLVTPDNNEMEVW